MKQELVDQLQREFPQYFQELWGDPVVTCMAFGVETGNGWYDIIHQLCADIAARDPGPNFRFEQIKEKFGGLRIYTSGWRAEANVGELLDKAE